MLKDTFRQNIIAERKKRGWTATHVASELKMSLPAYLQYEKGTRTPGLDMVEKISSVLDVPAAALLMTREPVAA